MTAPPAEWVAALVAMLFVAAVQHGTIGVLLSAGHVRVHRGAHLAFVSPPQ